jgi:GntR family transcriptional repressor for pyruvate dehydrogenase complex
MTSHAATGAELIQLIERSIAGAEPGDRLPSERQMADRLGVGRSLVREALRTLEERGVIDVQVGRGIFVRKVGPADAARTVGQLLRRQAVNTRHLLEARLMLECEAARLACSRATESHLVKMRRLLDEGAVAQGLPARLRCDLAFHLSIVRAGCNPVIETMFSAIIGPTAAMMMRSLSDRSVAQEALHERCYLDIVAHDAEAAASAMRDHLSVSERRYGRDLDVDLRVVAERWPVAGEKKAVLRGGKPTGGPPESIEAIIDLVLSEQ